MKTQSPSFSISRYPLRTISLALLFAGALSGIATSARADVVATYWPNSEFVAGAGELQPHDYLDGVSASSFQAHGSLTVSQTQLRIFGWGTTMSLVDYAGFTVTAQPGFQMTLTDFRMSTAVSAGVVTAFKWGYRVDDGSGFGDWTFDQTYSIGNPGFSYVGPVENAKTWDFADFSTTGTVEFGLFANSSGAGTAQVLVSQPEDMFLNGSVSAVPEPSTYALIAIAGTAALILTRRRKANS